MSSASYIKGSFTQKCYASQSQPLGAADRVYPMWSGWLGCTAWAFSQSRDHDFTLCSQERGKCEYCDMDNYRNFRCCCYVTYIYHYLLFWSCISKLQSFLFQGIIPEEFVNKPDEFYMPSLKQVTMTSYTGTRDEDNFVSILKKHGVVLEKIVIHRIKVGEKSFSPVVVSKIPSKV